MLPKIIIFIFFVFSSTVNTESNVDSISQENLSSNSNNVTDIVVGEVHYHLAIQERKSWIKALEHCWSHGMQLASITTQEESDKLEEAIQNLPLIQRPFTNFIDEPFWTSGADFPEEKESPRKFIWMSTGRPFTFVNWAKKSIYFDEPNNIDGNEHCVEAIRVDNKMKWNDNYCYLHRFFICEVRDIIVT